jgi:hypothetical protein
MGHPSQPLDACTLRCADDLALRMITLSPPLIAGEEEFAFIASTLRTVLTDAAQVFRSRS